MKLKVGDAAPSIDGSAILTLGAPSGQAALATLKIGAGAVNAKNDTVLLGGLDGTPRIAAREGQPLANAPKMSLKSIGAFDGNGSVIFFRALLQGGDVEETTDSALCAALPDGRVRLLVREGSGIDGVATLVGLPGTLAEGRWRAGTDRLGVRLSFSDGSQVISIVRVSGSAPEEWTVVHSLPAGAWVRVPEPGLASMLDGTSDLGLSLPGFGSSGGAAYRLTSRIGQGDVTAANNVALLSGYNSVLARKSDLAPGTFVNFQNFGDPVVGAAGRLAFTATLTGSSVNGGNKTGIWFATDGVTPRLVARTRADAPGGGQFGAFTSLALPDGPASGPIFTGNLVVDPANGITPKNASGLWGVDSLGTLQLLIRTGQSVTVSGTAKVIASFTALTPPAGSIGAAHGYDDAGHVSALVTFEDRSVAVLKLLVP